MDHKEELPHNLGQGELARLIPVGADSNKERKVTSTLLSTLMGVPEYARHMLGMVGCKVNSRSKISCYTEVVFKDKQGKIVKIKDSDRPDGLIVVQTGKSIWSALIEAKVGNAELDTDQVERYLDLAKNQGVDAVITISNQYANIPTHHPVKVNGNKTRSVGLYHWSWKSLLTEAVLHTDDNKDLKDITDETQHFILNEFKRFLQHDSTGLNTITQMNKSWSLVCSEGGLEKKSDDTVNAVASWHNLCRELTLDLSEETGTNVIQAIPRKYTTEKNGYENMLKDDVSTLVQNGYVDSTFTIKDAASSLFVQANIEGKFLTTTMTLRAPKDAKTARSSIGWVIKQLNKVELANTYVTACYAGKNTNKTVTLSKLLEDGYEAINDNNKNLPHSFDIYTKINLKLSELKGVKKFVEITRQSVFDYYAHIGQNLKKAPVSAPKIARDKVADEASSDDINSSFKGV